jgi:hypothetical protein
MFNVIRCFQLFIPLFTLSTVTIAQESDCGNVKKFIEYSNANYCTISPKEKIFILLDGTSGFSPNDSSWIFQRIFNSNIIQPSHEGDQISVAMIGDETVTKLKSIRVCAPKPVDKIDMIFDSPGKIKRDNKMLSCALKSYGRNLLNRTKSSTGSYLIEAINEIYNNPYYKFNDTNPGVKRKFYFITDLLQYSPNFNFYKLCGVHDRAKKIDCPTFKEIVNNDPRLDSYLSSAMPKFNKFDEIHIYSMQVYGLSPISAISFWKEFFIRAGVNPDNIFTASQLQDY